jgi:hypothetical protein
MTYLRFGRGRWLALAAAAALTALGSSCGRNSVTIGGGFSPDVFIAGIDQNELLFSDRRIDVQASDTDGRITRLRVYLDGELVFTDTYFSSNVDEQFVLYGDRASAGWHTVEAIATDDDGNTDHDAVDYQVAD